MPAERKLPSDTALQAWVDAGHTHEQIAEMVNQQNLAELSPDKRKFYKPVGRSAVSAALSRAGLTNPVRYSETIPWRVSLEHSRAYDLWMLRVAHRMQYNGKWSEDEERRFESWKHNQMKDGQVVLLYIPDSPEGFYRVFREEGDWEFIRPPERQNQLERARRKAGAQQKKTA